MLLPNYIPDVVALLKPSDFYNATLGACFKGIIGLDEKGKEVDPITLYDELVSSGLGGVVEAGGGRTFVHSLTSGVPAASNVKQYADIVRKHSTSRQLRKVSQQIETMNSASASPEDIMSYVSDTLDGIENGGIEKDLIPLKSLMPLHYAHLQELASGDGKVGLPSGFKELDALALGLRPTFYYIIGARPAMGKTAFALNIGLNIAKNCGDKAVAFFSLEQAQLELNSRLVSIDAHVPGIDLQAGRLSQDQWGAVSKAHGILANLPFFIDDSAVQTISDIRAKARRLNRKKGLAAVFVDYLQLITPRGYRDTRETEVAEISKGLKQLAKELSCPVIALAQLSRGCESRADKRPMMSDLRESGGLEQDADGIFMLYRDEYYDPNSPDKGIIEVNFAKNRHGPDGMFKLAFQKNCGRFGNLPKPGQAEPRPYWQDKE